MLVCILEFVCELLFGGKMRRPTLFIVAGMIFIGWVLATNAYRDLRYPIKTRVSICLSSTVDGTTIILEPRHVLREAKAKIANANKVVFNDIAWGKWKIFIGKNFWREIKVGGFGTEVNCS